MTMPQHMRAVALFLALAGLFPAWGHAQAGEGEYFRAIRQAVTDEDEERLYVLARASPWAFREVTHRLADLAMFQTLESSDREVIGGYNRFVVAGMLATVYLQVTDDASLAERLRTMRAWSSEDIRERRAIDALLSRQAADASLSVRPLEQSAQVCARLEDWRCVGMLHGAAGASLEAQGHERPAGLHYGKAADAFRRCGELPRLRDALLARGQLQLTGQRFAPAAEDLGAAVAVAEAVGDPAAQAGSLLLLGEALAAQGRLPNALAALERCRDVALEADLPVLASRAILMRTGLRDTDGPRAETADDYQAAARLAERGDDLILVSQAYTQAARAHAAAGDPSVGAEDIEKALAAARLAGFADGLEALLLLSAELHARIGDLPRALRRLDEAIRSYRQSSDVEGEARAQQQKGSILLEAEKLDEARGPLLAAVQLARTAGTPGIEGRAEGGLAALDLIAGDAQQARARYLRSASLLQEAGDDFQALRMRKLLEAMEAERWPGP